MRKLMKIMYHIIQLKASKVIIPMILYLIFADCYYCENMLRTTICWRVGYGIVF